MIKFAASFIFLAIIVAMASPRNHSSSAPVENSASENDSDTDSNSQSSARPKAGNGSAEVIIDRSPDGHFYADAMVNGAMVHFMVDTGATTIALTKADAQSAGVQFGSGEFTDQASGVNGEVGVKSVTLDRVAIGPVESHDVPAAVVDGDLNISLLGQSWLRRVGTVTIEDDRMILR
jgi:aspartyl protease family protein